MVITHRPLSSSFLGDHRILKVHHKEELLRGLWIGLPTSLLLPNLRSQGPRLIVYTQPLLGLAFGALRSLGFRAYRVYIIVFWASGLGCGQLGGGGRGFGLRTRKQPS